MGTGGVQRGREHAGLNDFRFHRLRHCYGSWLAKKGVDMKARMELMHHKTPAMTMRYSIFL
jgi:integrase